MGRRDKQRLGETANEIRDAELRFLKCGLGTYSFGAQPPLPALDMARLTTGRRSDAYSVRYPRALEAMGSELRPAGPVSRVCCSARFMLCSLPSLPRGSSRFALLSSPFPLFSLAELLADPGSGLAARLPNPPRLALPAISSRSQPDGRVPTSRRCGGFIPASLCPTTAAAQRCASLLHAAAPPPAGRETQLAGTDLTRKSTAPCVPDLARDN